MKITAVIASVLALSATSAMAEGDCAGKQSAALQQRQTTASLESATPRADTPVVVAQDRASASATTTISQ